MARLKRKKAPSSKKKKKQQVDTATAESIQNGTAAASPSTREVKLRTVKKPQPPAAKRSYRAARSEPGKIRGFVDKSLQFLREVKVELKKVTWPSRKQTIGSTAVVLILVMIISFFLGLVDIGLSSLIRVVLQ